ncbi:hypothetical protein [Flavobacterium nitrogenifigens]|uniref:hypothetical protein n=1 Tax=Flavobacterium nitrogenifigens TaxID=1617283 RepID=UPI0011EF7E06|nr:hypothetical protein [Flavobacterium nitrogenifigens]
MQHLEHEFLQEYKEIKPQDRKSLQAMAEREAEFFDFLNPARDFFNSQKSIFIQHYLKDILSLYEYFLQVKAESRIIFLEEKKTALFAILLQIYELEVKMLYRWYSDEIDELMALKKIDIDLLNWLRN